MGEQQDVALRRVIVAILVVLNISVVCFYVLWEVADTIAVNRAEEHGFDPQQLLPHFVPFWFAAQASLLSLLALDVLYDCRVAPTAALAEAADCRQRFV